MLSKDDVRDVIRKKVPQIVRQETKDIRAELASIRRDFEALTGKDRRYHGPPERDRSRARAHRRDREASRHQHEDRSVISLAATGALFCTSCIP